MKRALTLVATLTLLGASGEASAQKGQGQTGPQYELVPLGFQARYASATDVNEQHQVIGTLNPRAGDERAAFWQVAEPYAQPEVLPCPTEPGLPEPARCRANAINSLGTVVGYASGLAAKWTRSASGWELTSFPHPGDETYRAEAYDMLDDGSAAGAFGATGFFSHLYYFTPVLWDPAGNMTQLPIPSGFHSAQAMRLNPAGDAVGQLRVDHESGGYSHIYGALWVNTVGGHVAFVFNDLLSGITPRGVDGSFYVSATTGRIKAYEAGGSWNFTYEANPGPAHGINDRGDITGARQERNGGQPYLLSIAGTLVKLPVTKGGTGFGSAVSSDNWVAGTLDNKPVMWRPVR